MRIVAFLFGAALALASCATDPGGFDEAEEKIVTPQKFLLSDSPALEEWMTTPFKVHYDEVPLRDVFATHPLNSMRYRFEGLPMEAPAFELNSMGITRRQLLYSLAEAYGLAMSLEYRERVPYAIVVRHVEEAPVAESYLVQ